MSEIKKTTVVLTALGAIIFVVNGFADLKILSERNKTLLENGKDAMSEVVKILKEVIGERDNYYVAKSIIG
jgi:hypothetical protein